MKATTVSTSFWEAADTIKFEPSAYIHKLLFMLEKGVFNITLLQQKNKSGPTIQPCGIPNLIYFS